MPFNASEIFNIKKGTIKIQGTINDIEYRNKLISRGNGLYVMSINKALQKKIGFKDEALDIEVSMELDDSAYSSNNETSIEKHSSSIDVLTAIKTRRSIRVFSSKKVEKSKIETILEAGFCAPSAKNKRPWNFIVSKNKDFIDNIADKNNYKPLLTANCCIIVCGDSNIEGTKDFLLEDCGAAIENMLLAAHGLDIGATWCGLVKTNDKYKYICDFFRLPDKVIPMAIIALGYPDEKKDCSPRYDERKVHWEKW